MSIIRSRFWTTWVLASATSVWATSLSSICSSSYLSSVLPATDFIEGITLDSSSVTANAVYNSSTSSDFFPTVAINFCNVTLAYSHNGRTDDQVLIQLYLPAPEDFESRWLSTGGGGFAIYSGAQSLPGGVIYGAATGATDGGFGSFDTNADAVMLKANGTIDYETLYMFGYKAHWELSKIGKAWTKNIYNMTDSDKLWSYYQGCSEGGREGWSQIQRYGDEWDGAAIGAPAFRWSFQQTQHLFSNIVERTLDYAITPCELDTIINATITACDPLDGLTDGVVARSDLCLLEFDPTSIIGTPYYCAASSGGGGSYRKRQLGGGGSTPAQNGTVTATGVEVVKTIIAGLKDSKDRQVYLSYQPGAALDDAVTSYNSETGEWEVSVDGIGGEYIGLLVFENGTDITSLDGVTYDTLRDWMISGYQEYFSTLHTTWPDLSPFQEAGGKVIHFHGEQDFSIPTASSVRYWESVRSVMYPDYNYTAGAAALNDWYRLFMVPGAGHCAPNDAQPNGPFPQTNFPVLIDWVENGVVPTTLNATVLQGENEGQNQQLCAWPLRPLWTNGTMSCVYDQASIDTWQYDFDGVPIPVY